MGTVAPTNPVSNNASNNGLSDLLQTLTNENSPLLSTLSQPGIEAALQNAPAGDIVEISDQAQQLQSVDALFGISSTTGNSSTSLFSALATAESNTGAAASALNPGSSLADQFAAYQGNQQTQEAQTLLGQPQTINPQTGSLFDVFA